jgi:hypothetical protein
VSPLAALSQAASNGTVGVTGRNGVVTLSLPVGNYSVHALGFVGTSLYSGVGQVAVASAATNPSVRISLGPAIRLTGSVSNVNPGSNATVTAVIAYAADGTPTYSWATNGSYSFYLPAGAYSLLAVQGSESSGATIYAALSPVTLSYPTVVNLQPTAAISARFTVGTLLSSGTLFPAAGARVTISAGNNGPAVSSIADSNGTVAVFVPSALPLTSTTYCVGASATGFVTTTDCGVSPGNLASMSRFALSLIPVAVTVRAVGVPSGTSVTVNLTAASPTAINRTLVGGPTWSLNLPPGTYTVSGWAPTGSGSVVYRPALAQNSTVAFGSPAATLTLTLVSQTNSTGKLVLPTHAVLANVTVSISSPTFNTSVNGTNYTKGFFAPPGSYSAYATVSVGANTYVALRPVTISSSGVVTPSLTVTTPGYKISGTLVKSGGVTLPVNTSVTLTASSGATARVLATDGNFSAVLPGNTSYAASAAVVTLAAGPEGTYYQSWVAIPGSTCVLGSASTGCSVTLIATTQLVWLNGTLTAPGVPGLVSGTVRITGPSPYQNITVIPATNGTFSVQVLPGSYSLYATGGGGSSPLAAFVSVAVSFSASQPVLVSLSPTWTDTVSVLAPAGAAPLLGLVNVTVTNAFGVLVTYSNVAPSSPLMVALPVGSYTVSASSFGAPFGVSSRASANGTVRVVNGNVGTVLGLAYVYTYSADVSLVGTTHATVTSPGTASFSFTVRNSGTAPILVHPVGSPAIWGFNFTFSNVTLAPGAGSSTLQAGVSIQVPSGTATNHPVVVIDLELANNTVVGSISPTVNLVPYYGIAAGPSPSSPAQVGPSTALVPFYLANRGNTVVSVALTVVDLPRVNSLGWSVTFRGASATIPNGTVELNAFENSTYFVNLTTSQTIFIPVGQLTVQASVLNQSGSYQAAALLRVPTASVHPGSSNGTAEVTVVGPAVGPAPSNLPDWVIPLLSFIPAIALVVGVITYRWWRTRRWTRR